MIPVKYCIAYEEQSLMDNAEVVVNKYTDFDFGQMHTHSFIEICCLTKGNGWHILNDSLQRCSPGDLFVIEAGDSHAWIAENDEPMPICNLIFRPGFFDPALKGKTTFADMAGSFIIGAFDSGLYHSQSVHFSGDRLADVIRLYDTMLDEYRAREAGCVEFIRACAAQLIVSIFRKHAMSSIQSVPGHGASKLSLAPVFDYINVHFAEEIPLRQLASLVYLSPTYFSRVFKLCTGRTVTEYIQRVRIFNARAQLLSTDQPISAVAEANGYSDPKHFTRIFRRITGMSPTQCRQTAKNNGGRSTIPAEV